MSAGERPATRVWREALAEVDALLSREPHERQHALAELARSRPRVHSIVASLMRAEQDADAASFLEPTRSSASAPTLTPGAQLGPYRIISQVGEGGMGEVWLAARDDGLYEGEVAIKTLHPYFAAGALRERFLREANLLGRLAHPNIARLLDAGVSPEGLVYLVLEYVRGEQIDVWCDARSASVDQRLRLFLEVCAAVAHAHANLIVHRDIKPPNILVDEGGTPKLLDFGVAKLVESDARAERSELTRLTGRIFTPEYAAPEQILGQIITTATDVYALGVLLHKLLAGASPYQRSGNAAEVERAALHDEPTRPSRAALIADDASHVAAKRSTTPQKLQRALAGDLDSIVARALAKEPTQRYPSVLALAEDVRRHLAHEPILARPDPVYGRARKFVRRHRLGVAASVLVVAAVAAGVAGVVWQAQVARVEARKATSVRDFLISIFEQNSVLHPDGASARATTAEELLAIGAERIRTQLADAPDARAELLGVIGDMYGSMELPDRSIDLYAQKVEALRALYGEEDLRTAEAVALLGISHAYSASYEEGDRLLREAVRRLEREPAEHAVTLGTAWNALGHIAYRRLPSGEESAQHYAAARQVFERYAPEDPQHTEAYYGVSRVQVAQGDLAGAERSLRDGVALIEKTGANRLVLAGGYLQLGTLLRMRRDFAASTQFIEKAIGVFVEVGGEDHPFTADARKAWAVSLGLVGDHVAAEAEFKRAIAALERSRGALDAELTADALAELATFYYSRGELAKAREQFERSIAASRSKDPPGPFYIVALGRLVRTELYDGRVAEATRLADEYREYVRVHRGEKHRTFGNTMVIDAEVLLARGQPGPALQLAENVLATWPPPENEISPLSLVATSTLVRAALAANESTRAEQAARGLYERVNAFTAPASATNEERAIAALRYGQALCALHRRVEAAPLLATAVELRERIDAPASPWLAEARRELARCREDS